MNLDIMNPREFLRRIRTRSIDDTGVRRPSEDQINEQERGRQSQIDTEDQAGDRADDKAEKAELEPPFQEAQKQRNKADDEPEPDIEQNQLSWCYFKILHYFILILFT